MKDEELVQLYLMFRDHPEQWQRYLYGLNDEEVGRLLVEMTSFKERLVKSLDKLLDML